MANLHDKLDWIEHKYFPKYLTSLGEDVVTKAIIVHFTPAMLHTPDLLAHIISDIDTQAKPYAVRYSFEDPVVAAVEPSEWQT